MCSPKHGENTPEDAKKEANRMLNGSSKPSGLNGTKKQIAAALAISSVSLVTGLFAGPFITQTRHLGELNAHLEDIQNVVAEIKQWEKIEQEQFEELEARVASNAAQLAMGKRYTLEDELRHREEHSADHAAVRERLAVLEYKMGER